MYTVKYKRRGQWFWRRIKNVIEDGTAKDVSSVPYRFIFTKDKVLIELPVHDTAFMFSPERADMMDARRAEALRIKREKAEKEKAEKEKKV